jgi:predicted nuclease of predicted toxin-antitoxin system
VRWVADEGVDAPIVARLRELDHLVWYVAEMMAGITDEEVLALAQEQDAVLLTNDKDFGALVFQQRRVTAGIVLMRLAGLSADQKAVLVNRVIDDHGARLRGAFTVVTPRRVRIRPSR